jgi:hypothetical protein
MKSWNSSKSAEFLASCFIAVFCGVSMVAVDRLQNSQNTPSGAARVVILQADGVAPPPPPPSPKPTPVTGA